jgi:hypothetical protein
MAESFVEDFFLFFLKGDQLEISKIGTNNDFHEWVKFYTKITNLVVYKKLDE